MSRKWLSVPKVASYAALTTMLAAALAVAQPGQEAAGLVVERVRAARAPAVRAGNRIITVVRVDLRKYKLRILTEEKHGARRPVPRWVRDEHLAGAINAGMFLPNGRSVGFMAQDGAVVSNRRVTKYRGVVGFGPRRQGLAKLRIGGPGCGGGIDAFVGRYENVLQAYRMIDCHGAAEPWRNNMQYSVAAFGVDDRGRAVFVHSRTPYRMAVFNQMLVDQELGIRGLIYMEGGPEASLYVSAEGQRVEEIGSYETGFNENDDNNAFWAVPNVVGFQAR